MRLRRYIFGAAALALASGSLSLGLVGSASAASPNAKVTANGTVACGSDPGAPGTAKSGITGTITFNPPLQSGGTMTENTTVKITVSNCKITGNTNLKKKGVLTGTVKEDISSPTSVNDCTGLSTSAGENLTVKWTYKSKSGTVLNTLTPTIVTYPGYTTNASTDPPWASGGNAGFQLPGDPSTGTPSATGSFATGGGAASQAEAYLNLTDSEILTDCGNPGGLASAKFSFGQSSIGP